MIKGLRFSILVGIFAILLTPLVVTSSLFFPYISGKAFFFRIIVEIIFGLWLILALADTRYRPRRSLLLLALAGFTGVLVLATVFSQNIYHSFWSNLERMEGFIGYLHLFVYFLVVSSMLQTEKLWRWFFQASVGVSVIVAIYSLLQLTGKLSISQGVVRLDATFGNAIYLAVYMLIHIFMTAWLWSKWKKKSGISYLYGLVIILQATVLYFTATRGDILGLLVGFIVTAGLILLFGRQHRLARRISIVGLTMLVVVGIGFWLVKDASFVQNSSVLSRLANISTTDRTTESRLTIWQMSLQGFKEHPILGWGPENYLTVFNKYYQPKLWHQEAWFDRSHNIFLDWLINAGILGLVSYLSLFFFALYYLWRLRDEDVVSKSLLTGLLAGYFFQNIFVFDNLMSYVLFLSLLAYLHYRYLNLSPLPNSNLVNYPKLGTSLAIIIVPMVLFSVYFFNLKPIWAAQHLIDGMNPSASVASRLANFRQVFNYQTFVDNEASEQLVSVTPDIVSNKDIPDQLKKEFADLAVSKMHEQADKFSGSARTQLFLGSLLLRLGRTKEALVYLEKAHALALHKQTITFVLADAYMISGDKNKALALSKEAYELDETFPDARDRLINLYVEAKNYADLVKLWQAKVAAEPANVQFHFSLGAAYLANQQPSLAIKELQTASQIDPRVKAQADQLIADIRAGRNPLAQ